MTPSVGVLSSCQGEVDVAVLLFSVWNDHPVPVPVVTFPTARPGRR